MSTRLVSTLLANRTRTLSSRILRPLLPAVNRIPSSLPSCLPPMLPIRSAAASLSTAAPQRMDDDLDNTPTAWVEPDNRVTIRFGDYATTSFNGIWLRDHCRCPSCFHAITKQRLIDTASIPLNIKPSSMAVSPDGKTIKFVWEDDGHESVMDLAWLRQHSYNPKLAEKKLLRDKQLWDASIAESLPIVQYKDVMANEEGLAKWLEHIDVYGIGFVDGVPATPEATEQLGRRISFIRETHYGGFWDFTANLEHGDTAYTTLGLPAHTDTTYFTDPIGLQLFHLLEHRGTGGESLYVDGFHVAHQLQTLHPWAYDILSRTRISSHSAGDKSTLIEPTYGRPILNHDPTTRELYQIRFNNDDRSTLDHLSASEVRDFYAALKEWIKLLRDKRNELWTQLRPGRAVMVDNWRVLHGRAAFTGHRRLTGCYHNWDDYRSRVKTVLDKKTI
ncbi:trimethyllysine dioxygenase [Spizellomyces punctatus DAOM BR117]|uniref:trimethyllysine dioxygenase n=1 Tax=Spizellomyces punctatus (strain DAOM BR117) TaxID=645134 RepID=A0A0L0HKI3_SPIPD|nr:trimethyllysine dioxygenase [Spizellomyces punctatus DAOM BR117]KND01405.1 trimethyllysine dioxygenase [Spizellomyces punctatus DAOM BR117]|eukprot:XP_016609444.1 trimethyllysine dioxygenase [Spizellomyces punctatus DAOM BR117]